MDSLRLLKYCRILLLVLFSCSLSGCIDLATTKSLTKSKNYGFYPKGYVFVMRGGLGGIFSTGMNQLQYILERQYHIRSESTVWYKNEQLSRFIAKNYGTVKLRGPIILVGHSLGANDQIKVARDLLKARIPVALLITIDAVSPLTVPPNVKHVLNIYKPSFVPMFSGLKIKAMDPKETIVENIDVTTLQTVRVNHFTIDKNDAVQNLMLERTLSAIKYRPKRLQ